MESEDLLKTLLVHQEAQMRLTFADLPKHRSPASTRDGIPGVQAHIQALDEIDYVLKAGRLARWHAHAQYEKDQKDLHKNAAHVLSTRLLHNTGNISPEMM
tara:strand:+ start:405 stop:707 length:303 start_codon:yes stop_codon:yes gene_type:complete